MKTEQLVLVWAHRMVTQRKLTNQMEIITLREGGRKKEGSFVGGHTVDS
jgi:hypothetical protein